MAGMLNDRLKAKVVDTQDPTAPDIPVEVPADGVVVEEEVPAEEVESDVVDDDDEGAPNVSPEEQQAYEDFVSSAMELIYEGGKVNPYILSILDDDPTDIKEIFGEVLPLDEPTEDGTTLWEREGPVIALAAAAVVVVLELVRKMGDERPDDTVLAHAASEIVADIADTSNQTGGHKYTDAEASEAYRKAADLWREAASAEGLIDLTQATEEFNQIVAADKAGAFGDGGENGGVRA